MINTRKLKAAMIEAGCTQKELAEKLGISENSVSKKINGKRSFNIDEACAVCEALNIVDVVTKAQIFLL